MRELKALQGPHPFGDQSISIQPQEQQVTVIKEGYYVEKNELGSLTAQSQDINVNFESRSSIVCEGEYDPPGTNIPWNHHDDTNTTNIVPESSTCLSHKFPNLGTSTGKVSGIAGGPSNVSEEVENSMLTVPGCINLL